MDCAGNLQLRIVCVGSSAGGLEAVVAFLKVLPKTTSMAFVIIQHLEPYHKSALAEILSRETTLNIREAKNNARIEPGHGYVIPPNALMSVSGGRLKLTSRVKRRDGLYLPIDFFLTSLAKAQGKKAVGVILSGTGSDGTLGAKAIKRAGGTVFAQDEKTAKYFGMPESVIASGAADFVLSPGEIARQLTHIKVHGRTGALKPAAYSPGGQDSLNRILVLLRDLTGVDFLHYKQTTIGRRIARRMQFHNTANYGAYYSYLKENPEEADVLRKDILIPVTSFFREPKTFAVLKKKVFPLLTGRRQPQNPIRLWVPACSSGEEVYSLAIALYEFLEERQLKPYIQVFGTDLSEGNIEKARAGLYPASIAANLSPVRLRRFFTKTETGYKIAKAIRELCIFAKHDITGAVPLSNMDIISCRNLLIYLDNFLQNKALSTLHYALKPSGFLVLGAAESVSAVPDLFTPIDKKQKVYSKNLIRKTLAVTGTTTEFKTAKTRKAAKEVPLKKGSARLGGAPARKTEPAKEQPMAARHVKLITVSTTSDIVKLRKEFARTAERLNAISEEKDTFNEELKAASEELQSTNEELQSTNEELETSKEELQSTNEELLTLNEELQNKNVELTQLNSDLNNVFASTNFPLIIVGNDLRIKRFTPTARKVMNLIPADVGRPLGDIKLNIDIPDLEKTLLDVIEDMSQRELEVEDKEGRWYSMRLRPYRTVDNKIDGAVISLIDIDTIKKSREEAQFASEYSQAILDTMREPLVVLDNNLRVLSANRAFYSLFRLAAPDAEGKPLHQLGAQWDNPGLRELLGKILLEKTHFNDFELAFEFPGKGPKTMVLNGRQLKPHGKTSPMILLVLEDITERKKAGDILKRDSDTLEELVKKRSGELLNLQVKLERAKHLSDVGTLAATVAHELRNTLSAIGTAEYNIRRKADNPRIAGSLANIVRKIAEGEQIINNVLSYSRIKTSHFEPVRINDLLALCVAEVKLRALDRGITVSANLAPTEKVSIEADPVQLAEVFANVLNNALDAVAGQTGVIELGTGIKDSVVSFSIKDNGEGIAAQNLKKVLDPFFTTKAKGTGLGLAVCNQILMLHDGTIVIESEKRKGTTVLVTLPLLRKKNV